MEFDNPDAPILGVLGQGPVEIAFKLEKSMLSPPGPLGPVGPVIPLLPSSPFSPLPTAEFGLYT